MQIHLDVIVDENENPSHRITQILGKGGGGEGTLGRDGERRGRVLTGIPANLLFSLVKGSLHSVFLIL